MVSLHARHDRPAGTARARSTARSSSDSPRSTASTCPRCPGAREAVERLAARWPLGLASSSNRELIDLALELLGVEHLFAATVSSEEVASGKPAPDVYLEAARRLGVDPTEAAAVEDSNNGILAAKAAGMRVVALPNRHFPPDPAALEQADVVLDSLGGANPGASRVLKRRTSD